MIDQELCKLGFVNFIHLRPELRDGRKRMVWSGLYKDQLISIRIIFMEDNQCWVVESISCDSKNDARLNDLLMSNQIGTIIDFIRSLK